ncbi:rod shape determining protein RodA [Fibrobacter sp. UWT2]|jgi:rod shape determining protein RodA|uniref:rod shape-determining protein RodA n=1 Tax=Fibrobacter sp. UWT2 TaxID=1896224 RepID=UPI000921E661|nr:rod shape-determining protein RodA [Fibrobacter sp. UWT2]SHL58935.1 rod shape determining protein RodA [Fibrobacter sp. UWT2]
MKPNRLLNHSIKFDWMFIALTLALMSVGVALVYSATIAEDASVVELFWFKQIVYFVFGSVFAVALIFVRVDWLKRAAIPLYALALVLLVVVLFFAGDVVKGAGRWIDLGIFKLQPSEFAKIAYLLIFSYWLSKHPVSLYKMKTFVVPFFLFIVPFALVLKQPDLSTALVFIAVTMVGFFFAGLTLTDMFLIVSPVFSVFFSHSQALVFEILWGLLICVVVFALFRRRLPKVLTALILMANIFAGYASTMAWNMLEPHQQKRVNTFLDPMSDPLGDGYQVLQSLTAIGSGGLTGKGFGNGSQTNLAFLPEEHTDFIFSVLGEQFGFLGCAFVLVLYALFLWRATSISKLSSDPFVTLMVMGASTIFLFHIMVNIAMTIGLMPVTGLPLPFLSYGGSFALTCMVLVGFLLCLRFQARRR